MEYKYEEGDVVVFNGKNFHDKLSGRQVGTVVKCEVINGTNNYWVFVQITGDICHVDEDKLLPATEEDVMKYLEKYGSR